MSRLVRLKVGGQSPQFPPVKYNIHLLEYLDELGYFTNTGNGFIPLNYKDIETWQRLSERIVSFTEIKALIALSADFVNTYYESSNKDYKAPYTKL